MESVVRLALALMPVLVFLLILILLDSYKLVTRRLVASLLLAGAVAAALSLVFHLVISRSVGIGPVALARYVAPVTEELLKGICVVFLVRSQRIGFLVDSAIAGFAVGAGFATFENVHYFLALDDANVLLWLIRGFGTAVMHGSVTAIMAIVSKHLVDTHGSSSLGIFIPGWLVAAGLHSVFNHFLLSPNQATAILLLVLPIFFVTVFRFSESRTREWLGSGFDSDAELLRLVNSGQVSNSRIGEYLETLKSHLEGPVVADMVCLLRLRLELSIKAKGMLLMRQAGFEAEPDPETEEHFAELEYLEKSIGRTGLLALNPIFHLSDRDLWQYYMLGRT
ncbi:MAG: PrsW family intramembrane metalloprotease [Acidobacteriota bacterium]|nr:PrsW family intramembrane metalloprotease [Acidobacteriota bacterium]